MPETVNGTLSVKVFGPQARLAGTDVLTVQDVSWPIACADVIEALQREYPSLGASLASSRLAVNHEFGSVDTMVSAEDEVALIGLVSGG